LISIILSIIVAIMSIQLFNKHRFMENEHARILHAYEEVNRLYPANRVLKSSNWTIRIPSRWLWKAVLWSLIIASIGSLILLFMGKLDP